jgi:hypothetical protein
MEIFGSNKDEINEKFVILYKSELHALCRLHSIVWVDGLGIRL